MSELDLGKMEAGARAADQTDWFGPDELWAHGFIGAYNSAHIANCDPPTIIALIDRLEKAEALNTEAHSALVGMQGVVEQLLPGIGAIACRDYRQINEAPIAAMRVIGKFEIAANAHPGKDAT